MTQICFFAILMFTRLVSTLRGVLLALCLGMGAAVASDAPSGPGATAQATLAQVGERMYREGILPSGKAMRAVVRGEPMMEGQAACITCHRRSGLGSSEGRTVVSPVTGASLSRPREASASQIAYLSAKVARRPGYSDETLARAIRDGIDSAGQALAEPMPRYQLSDEELAPLVAYLKTLTSGAAPGVTEDEIHFATVVAGDVAPEQRRAMLDILETYFRDKNAETRYEGRRARQGPWTMKDYKAYRKWRLHVWELSGPPDSWRRQLAEYYRRQPVFAVLGGLAAGAWQPVHEFCETAALPCLFPNTDLPVVSDTGFYSIYFSRGITLEAEALAKYLRETEPPRMVFQEADGDAAGVAAAASFRRVMARRGDRVGQVVDGQPANIDMLLRDQHGVNLVLWQRDPDLAMLEQHADALDRVFLSASLMRHVPDIPQGLRNKVHWVYPFVLPEAREQRQARMRAWLRLKGIAAGDARVQANTYFAVTVAADALMRVAFNFSREYFVERIEDMVDSALATSVYPHVSLGPNQRFISKGAYIVRQSPEGALSPVSPWIIP